MMSRRISLISVLVLLMIAFISQNAQSQAMVSKGQSVNLIWFNGIVVNSTLNNEVITPSANVNFHVIFQLPADAPGIRKKAYIIPLYWISDLGTFPGEGTVTPKGKVIARFHIKDLE